MKKLLAVSLFTLGLGLSFSHASQAATTEAQTKHPIVLVPGIFAFDSIASIDYWYKIPAALQSQGATVYVPKINAFDSSAKRGEALIAQLEDAEPGGEMVDAQVKVLSEYVKHHVKEEHTEMFPKAKASSIDMVALGALMAARKGELLAQTA